VTFKVYPYKQGSASAKTLAKALECKVLKLKGSKFKPKARDVVINWGSSKVPDFDPACVLNSDVTTAQCKLKTFRVLTEAGVRTPDFTVDNPRDVVGFGYPIVCRTKLNGHSGEGIVIANNEEELVDAPLYTQYVKKKDEYRVHCVGSADAHAFFAQRKARKLDVENPDWKVRNLAGGFVFVEVPIEEVPKDVIHQAEQAVIALDLDFAGVDVIWNEREGKAYVLELNTACGLEERTAERYRDAIHSLL